jgi:hypothetical protein
VEENLGRTESNERKKKIEQDRDNRDKRIGRRQQSGVGVRTVAPRIKKDGMAPAGDEAPSWIKDRLNRSKNKRLVVQEQRVEKIK